MGLIGKIHLTSEMTEEDIKQEIRTVFQGPMGGDLEFPFVFLQPAGEGSRTLVIPAQSSTYRWTAQQVARLGGQKKTTYILAQADMPCIKFCDNDISEEDDQSQLADSQPSIPATHLSIPQTQLPATQSSPKLAAAVSRPSVVNLNPYSEYVSLIDLTKDSESDSDNDIPVIHVTNRNRTMNPAMNPDPVSTKHLLLQHQEKIIIGLNEDNYQRINVRRAHLFKDAFNQFAKLSFNVYKMLRVIFIGEQAVDEGGPRREFFNLLMRECFENSGLFAGYPDHVVPLHNVQAIDKNKFAVIGKMISTSLVQGGESPSCFAKAVADHIIYNHVKSEVCIEDIPDVSIQHSLQEILTSHSNEQLQAVFDEGDFDFLFTCGYNKPTSQIKINDVDTLVKSVWLHYAIFHPHAALEQLKKGINDTLAVDELIISHPDSMWGLFVASKTYDVTTDYLSDSFVIHYSDNGSNNRTKEEAIVLFWLDYIFESKDRDDVTLSRILQFYTGSSRIPAAGFPKDSKIYFTSAENRLPWTSTCDLSITFPRYMGTMEEDQFREKMDLCILGSFGFGIV